MPPDNLYETMLAVIIPKRASLYGAIEMASPF